MMALIPLRLMAAGLALGLFGAAAPAATWRGWLSDEQCARGRASGGVYTGTNPDCARRCVAAGAKIVLIDADHKAIIKIENQAQAHENIGDYVEVEGSVDPAQQLLHIDSLRLISKGAAKCDRRAAH